MLHLNGLPLHLLPFTGWIRSTPALLCWSLSPAPPLIFPIFTNPAWIVMEPFTAALASAGTTAPVSDAKLTFLLYYSVSGSAVQPVLCFSSWQDQDCNWRTGRGNAGGRHLAGGSCQPSVPSGANISPGISDEERGFGAGSVHEVSACQCIVGKGSRVLPMPLSAAATEGSL